MSESTSSDATHRAQSRDAEAGDEGRESIVQLLGRTGRDRSLRAMLLLGISSGLPYAVLAGTLYAWFTEADVEVSTIGVLSWIILAYAFKFLWSPTLHRSVPPIAGRLGSRRGWMLLFQLVVMLALGTMAPLDPSTHLGLITLAALVGVVASASQDIVIDAWRIEIARDDAHLDSLSAIYQVGYRTATFLGGFVALMLAARLGWHATFFLLATMMVLGLLGVRIADEPERLKVAGEDDIRLGVAVPPRIRHGGLLVVLAGWATAIGMLGWFMVRTVTMEEPPNARLFIRGYGPWIVGLTVLLPALVSAILLRWENGKDGENGENDSGDASPYTIPSVAWRRVADTLHRFILEPLMEVIARLRWAAPLVLVLILSYRFTDLVWGAFAYPFYLGADHGAMGYTLDEVALASKMIGALVTIGGTAVGAVALKIFGRMPCLIAGAVLAAVTNLLFWDLATDAVYVGGFLEISRLGAVFAAVGIDARLALLITAIAGENLAVGFASVTYVAYLSSIVNPSYAAIQYALMASLTFLIGTLGRGALGEMIEEQGFAYVFVITAVLGGVAIVASILETIRLRWGRPAD